VTKSRSDEGLSHAVTTDAKRHKKSPSTGANELLIIHFID